MLVGLNLACLNPNAGVQLILHQCLAQHEMPGEDGSPDGEGANRHRRLIPMGVLSREMQSKGNPISHRVCLFIYLFIYLKSSIKRPERLLNFGGLWWWKNY